MWAVAGGGGGGGGVGRALTRKRPRLEDFVGEERDSELAAIAKWRIK